MEGLMEQAEKRNPSGPRVESNLDALVARGKAVAQSSHAELLTRIVDGRVNSLSIICSN